MNDPSRLLERSDVDTREGPLACEVADLIPELLHLCKALLALLLCGCDAHKVLEELGAGLLLEQERKLDGAVQEVGNDFDVLLLHVTGRKGGGTETNTTGDLSRSVTRDGVFWKIKFVLVICDRVCGLCRLTHC